MIKVDNLENTGLLVKSSVFNNTVYGCKQLIYFIKVSARDFDVDLNAFKQYYPKDKISKAKKFKVTIVVEGIDA